MNPILQEILESRQVTSDKGERFPLRYAITPDVGEFLQRVVIAVRPKISLEVGLAYGISTLFICEALKKVGASRHIVMDPYESTYYKDIGLKNLRKAGYDELIEFVEGPSEIVLPELLKRKTRIDFAFVDGWHTFDHTLVDFFYINRMLNVNGVVVFDDVDWAGVSKVCHLISRYPCYRIFDHLQPKSARAWLRAIRNLINGCITTLTSSQPCLEYVKKDMNISLSGRSLAFIKENEDNRAFTWHREF